MIINTEGSEAVMLLMLKDDRKNLSMGDFCKNRTVVVTGAGSGHGRAYAMALGAQGANLIVNDTNANAVQETVDIITRDGGSAIANLDSITDYNSAFDIVNSALGAFGNLHAIINTAGHNRDRAFTALSEDDWDQVMRVTLKGHFCISSHAAKYWRQQSEEGNPVNARIINTSSRAGLFGAAGQSNYSAASGAVLTLTLSQAAELSAYGITANVVAPQSRTAMTEKFQAGPTIASTQGEFDASDPSTAALLICYLVSAQSSHISGHCFESIGGKLAIAQGWKSGSANDKAVRYDLSEIGDVIEGLLKAHA